MNRFRSWSSGWLMAILLVNGCGTEPLQPVPAVVEVISGDLQEAPRGQPVPQPIVVGIKDEEGLPMEGVLVAWTTLHGGTVVPVSARSGVDGTAQASWVLGPNPGEQSLLVSVASEEVVVSALATPPPPEDWTDVLDFTVNGSVVDGTLVARIELRSRWAGTIRLRTPHSCLWFPRLHDPAGQLVSTFGCCGCWTRPTNHVIEPNGKLQGEFTTGVSQLEDGDYVLRALAEVVSINGTPAVLSDVETVVAIGGSS